MRSSIAVSSGSSSICMSNATVTDAVCNADDSLFNVHFFIFVVAQILAGAGTTPLFSLGPAYMDENVHPQSMPGYLGFFYLAALLGPGLGALFGGQLLSLYVDIVMVTYSSISTYAIFT